MSQNIKCLTPQEEERFLDILKNRKDAERAYMLYHLMLITGLRISEALSLNVEHASRAKVELKVMAGFITKRIFNFVDKQEVPCLRQNTL